MQGSETMRRQRAVVWIAALLLAGAAALAACTDAIPEAPPTAASVDRVDNRATNERQAQSEQQSAPDSEPLDQLAAITQLHENWAAQLTSLELQMDVAVETDDLTIEQVIAMQLRLEPLELYMQIEIADLFGGLFDAVDGEEADMDAIDQAELEEALATTIQFLLVDDRAYLSLSDEGWAELPAAELFGSEFSSLTGGFSDDAAAALTAQANAALLCAELTGGSVIENELNGAPVWTVSCDVDIEAMAAMLEVLDSLDQDLTNIPGMPIDDALVQIETFAYSIQIDQRSGALLAFDVALSLSDEEAGPTTVATSGRTISWNQPIEFPTPTPLIEEPGAAYE